MTTLLTIILFFVAAYLTLVAAYFAIKLWPFTVVALWGAVAIGGGVLLTNFVHLTPFVSVLAVIGIFLLPAVPLIPEEW